jgi:hypothetical protein
MTTVVMRKVQACNIDSRPCGVMYSRPYQI